jgi:SAM-dependent methyltransferase
MGLEIVEQFLDDAIVPQLGKFDVVHLSQVLEHIPHPRDMVTRVHTLLEPDGLICVVVPNDYNPFQIALRNACGFRPWWVAPPHHINFFDFASLKQLLECCGFKVIHQETTFPIDMFLLMGDNYIGDNDLGRACHGRRKNFDLNLSKAGFGSLKQELYKALAGLGLGREVVLIGRKQ